MDFITNIAYSSYDMLLWVGIFFIGYSVLEYLTPCNPKQHLSPRNIFTDISYMLIMPIFTGFIYTGYMYTGIYILFHNASQDDITNYLINGYGPLSQWPLWVQAMVVFILSDIMLYWFHRWFHGRNMWRWHAIHHSSTPLEWHATFRFHPVNEWLSFTLVNSIILWMGFSPASIGIMGTFNLIYSTMVHANLDWTFGPFKYVFASPVFHRWHHTSQEEGMNKNFAPTFPFLDLMFGTFYMPKGRLPETYGVTGADIPNSFWGQIIWPFRQKKITGNQG